MIARSWPTLLIAAACAGLALANAARAPGAGLLLVGLAGVAAALANGGRARPVLLAVAVGLAGWSWGSTRLGALEVSLLEDEIGTSRETVAIVTGPARHSGLAVRVPAEVTRFGGLELRERVLLTLPVGRSPPQGAILNLRAEAEAPRTAEEGNGFDERGWLARKGVHVVLRGGPWTIVGRRGGIGGLADRLRGHVSDAIGAGLSGERRAVLAGIVLGENEGLSAELGDSFKASGLYHLLAVSGQNVGFLAAAVIGLGWLLGVPRAGAQLAALAAIAGYVLAVGWQPSVVRAGVAGGLASLAWLFSRPTDRWHFMALGAAVLLAWNPASLLEPGFQLSFAAVAAIFTLVPRLARVLDGYPVPRPLALAIALSVACGGATAPIAWLHFGEVPLYSLPANILATAAVAPLLGLALLGTLVEPLLPSAAPALAWLNGWLAAYLAACARLVAELPHARVRSGVAVAAVLGFVGALLLLRRLPPWRRPLAVASASLLVPALLIWQFRPQTPALPPPTGLRITFLDVGQGDAILVQVPQGAVLVDQGPPEARVARQLRSLGVRRLTAVVLTHPQRDHIGGAADVLRRLPVDGVLDPRLAGSSSYEAEALAAAAARGVPVVTVRAGSVWRLGLLHLRALWPDRPGLASEDPNRLPVVLHASYGEVDALLTADAETEVTAPLHDRRVEILKVAHHGSEDAGLERELRQLRPTVAVISCGRGNDYGHPRAETLAALATVPGLRLYRTDLDGRIVVESDGRSLSVRTER